MSLQGNSDAELTTTPVAVTERSLITLKEHPITIKRAKTNTTKNYDEYMYMFVLKDGIDLEYLKATFPIEHGKQLCGIHHIIECLESKTQDAIVICKDCFENKHLPFSKAVRKQGFEKGCGNTISPRFGNWTKHLKDMHGIENEEANLKANQQAQVARSIVNKHELFTTAWENGRDATVAAYIYY
jgi:hypothetical protein